MKPSESSKHSVNQETSNYNDTTKSPRALPAERRNVLTCPITLLKHITSSCIWAFNGSTSAPATRRHTTRLGSQRASFQFLQAAGGSPPPMDPEWPLISCLHLWRSPTLIGATLKVKLLLKSFVIIGLFQVKNQGELSHILELHAQQEVPGWRPFDRT